MDIRKHEDGVPGPDDKNKKMLKLDFEEIKQMMGNSEICSTSCYELCKQGDDFETGKTVFLQAMSYKDKSKKKTPFSHLDQIIVLNYGDAMKLLKDNKISLKVTGENPFGVEESPKKDTSDEEAGTSRKRKREQTELPKAKKTKKSSCCRRTWR